MNIQDIISTIINYVKNMDKKDLVIFILIALLFYRTRNVEGNENVAIDDSTLNSSHLAAIRNLGNLAKSLQDGNNIVLPGDVKINGKLSVGPNEDIKIFSDGRSKISMKMDDKVGTIQAYKQGDIYRLYFDDKIDELYVKGKISGEKDLTINKNLTVNNHTHTKTVLVDGSANFYGTIYANRDDENTNSIVAQGTANFNMIKATGSSNFDGTIYANRSDDSAIYSKGNIVAEKNNDTFPFIWKITGGGFKKLKVGHTNIAGDTYALVV